MIRKYRNSRSISFIQSSHALPVFIWLSPGTKSRALRLPVLWLRIQGLSGRLFLARWRASFVELLERPYRRVTSWISLWISYLPLAAWAVIFCVVLYPRHQWNNQYSCKELCFNALKSCRNRSTCALCKYLNTQRMFRELSRSCRYSVEAQKAVSAMFITRNVRSIMSLVWKVKP